MYNYLIFDILVTCLDFYEMKHYSNNEIKKRKKRKKYTDKNEISRCAEIKQYKKE